MHVLLFYNFSDVLDSMDATMDGTTAPGLAQEEILPESEFRRAGRNLRDLGVESQSRKAFMSEWDTAGEKIRLTNLLEEAHQYARPEKGPFRSCLYNRLVHDEVLDAADFVVQVKTFFAFSFHNYCIQHVMQQHCNYCDSS